METLNLDDLLVQRYNWGDGIANVTFMDASFIFLLLFLWQRSVLGSLIRVQTPKLKSIVLITVVLIKMYERLAVVFYDGIAESFVYNVICDVSQVL